MFTSAALFALGFLASAPAADSPSWLTDYTLAREQGEKHQKPLAVFLGNGASGWNQVSRDGELGKEIKKLLASNYVCVYVDTSKKEGKKLASAFDITEDQGLVISDRTGAIQAFRHEGDLTREKLASYLRRFADPDLVVRVTETNPSRTSNYPAEEQVAPPQYGGVRYYSGRSC